MSFSDIIAYGFWHCGCCLWGTVNEHSPYWVIAQERWFNINDTYRGFGEDD